MKEALICHVAAKTDAVTNAVLITICVITIVGTSKFTKSFMYSIKA